MALGIILLEGQITPKQTHGQMILPIPAPPGPEIPENIIQIPSIHPVPENIFHSYNIAASPVSPYVSPVLTLTHSKGILLQSEDFSPLLCC